MVEEAGKWYMHAVQPIRGRVRFAGFALKAARQENGRGASASWGRYTRATPVGDDGRVLLPVRRLAPHTC